MTGDAFDAEAWAAVSALFDAWLAVPEAERPAWLEALRASRPDRHAGLLRLIAADAEAAQAAFLRSPAIVHAIDDAAGGTRGDSDAPAASVRQIGPYRLLQQLGEGGMGEVWLAEQAAPVKRRVALKLIKAGMDTRHVIARFEAERQALAVMDHPAIAKVFDAGETVTGRPYFVMEYVPGDPINTHCDRQRLTTIERIALFVEVCNGVQHAHQKGIIHRDLKPSNILVELRDGKALPRIIDFGVAKATAQRLTEKTLVTELGAMIGTPEYMSPEQVELTGVDVDTRSDVYALGVVLYELLVGALPFDSKVLRHAAFDELRRMIREVDPPRPSARATTPGEATTRAASNRRTEPARLAGLLRGDLDWITMKALEKDRTRRYGSPSELAADLARHLDNLPVNAGPPSMTYRARKFVRRHRLGVSLAAIAVLGLVVVAAAMARQSARIAREAATSNRALQFLTEIFEVSDPSEARGKTVTAREILDRGAAKIDTDLNDEPLIQAKLFFTLGEVYQSLGLYDSAQTLLDRSLALRRELLGPESRETIESIEAVALLLLDRGSYSEAEPYFREVLAGRRKLLGADHPDTADSLNNLGLLLREEGKRVEAERYLREALQTSLRTHNDDGTLTSMNSLGLLLREQGKFEEAQPILEDLVKRCRSKLGGDHPHTLTAIGNLALLLQAEGKLDESEPYFREVSQARRRVLGSDHPQTLLSEFNLGFSLRVQGKLDEAEPYFREALSGFRGKLGDDHPRTLLAMNGMGALLQAQGKLNEAEPYFRESLQGRRRVIGDDHADTIDSVQSLASLLAEMGKLDEAEALYREAVERANRTLGAEHSLTLAAEGGLGDLYTSQGRFAEAERSLTEVLATARRALPAGHRVTGRTLNACGRCLTALGRYDEAEAALLEAQGRLAKSDGASLPDVARNLTDLYTRWGKPEDAAKWRAGAKK